MSDKFENCVSREKIIRTFHTDKECKDYNGGPCKYLGLFMREIVFQNDEYKHTVISINPYCLLFGTNYEMEELYELPYEKVEKLCHEYALNFKGTEKFIIKDKPKDQLINILEGYELKKIKIGSDGRLKLFSRINKLINANYREAHLYYDEELGDVFIHFNIKELNNISNNTKGMTKINNRFYKA